MAELSHNFPHPSEMVDRLRPFVGLKLNPPRGEDGYYLPTPEVDIHATSAHINADVRAVDEAGVWVFWHRGRKLIPWGKIRSVRVRRAWA